MSYIERRRDRYLDPQKRSIMITSTLFDPSKKTLINFIVLQLYKDNNSQKNEVIKHDFSHGCYNFHEYYLGHNHRTEVTDESITSDLYYRIKADILQNWQYYQNEYLRRFLPEELP
jgi:hypothetical protein